MKENWHENTLRGFDQEDTGELIPKNLNPKSNRHPDKHHKL
jgi:hypothetical protein